MIDDTDIEAHANNVYDQAFILYRAIMERTLDESLRPTLTAIADHTAALLAALDATKSADGEGHAIQHRVEQIDTAASTADALLGRLANWKFTHALRFTDGQPEDVTDLVDALALAYGDSGWFGGHQGEIVGYALATIGVPDD